jgi:hypothetical protein
MNEVNESSGLSGTEWNDRNEWNEMNEVNGMKERNEVNGMNRVERNGEHEAKNELLNIRLHIILLIKLVYSKIHVAWFIIRSGRLDRTSWWLKCSSFMQHGSWDNNPILYY